MLNMGPFNAQLIRLAWYVGLPDMCRLERSSLCGLRFISNDADGCKHLFSRSLLGLNTLLRRRTNCVGFWRLCSFCVTLSCSAVRIQSGRWPHLDPESFGMRGFC